MQNPRLPRPPQKKNIHISLHSIIFIFFNLYRFYVSISVTYHIPNIHDYNKSVCILYNYFLGRLFVYNTYSLINLRQTYIKNDLSERKKYIKK